MKHLKNYLGLWLILIVAFVTFTIISALEQPVTIFNHELKSSEIWPTLTKTGESSADISIKKGQDVLAQARKAVSSAGETSEGPSQLETTPIDTLPKTILFFGDSMLDGLYPRLAAYANENGHTLYAVIWYSSTTSAWAKSDNLNHYINDLKPDYIFISIGANELYTDPNHKKDAERDGNVKKIIAEIGNIPYIWIGPPNWKPKTDVDLNDIIAGNVGVDHFFYSAELEFPRMKDGSHPTHEAAIGWMDKIIEWMKTNSSHPIKMDLPKEKKARAKRVFTHSPSEI